MSYGYCGRVLRVNLSSGALRVEQPGDEFYREHIGGVGMIAHYLLKELEPRVDPLSPGNKLIFACGVITGAPVGGSGRNGVGAKSPLTGAIGKSEAGGFWGAELKRAGFDAIIFDGKAEKPVYVWISGGKAELRPAEHLWGKSTMEAQDTIRAELADKRIRVAGIGPGGGKLVRFACIINDLKSAAGRTGMGAVMGSKNLKAIAVRGDQAIGIAHPDRVQALSRWLAENYKQVARGLHEFGTVAAMVAHNAIGNMPTCNFREGYFTEVDNISAETVRDTIRIGMDGCFACPIRCKKVISVREPYVVDPAYGGPEYEALAVFGSNCGVQDLKAIAKTNELCQAYGLDTISTGGTVAFAMECFEQGLLSPEDTGGIELRFGSTEAMVKMVEMIGRREGLGDLLAEGSRRAARSIGRGAEELAINVKGLEPGMHEPRLKQGLGLGYAISPHGADHGTGFQDTFYDRAGPNLERVKVLGFLDPLPLDDLSQRKVAMFVTLNHWQYFLDSLVLCHFVPFGFAQIIEQLVGGVTGWDMTIKEALTFGEKVANKARLFNIREGLTAEDDVLPKRFHSPTRQGALQHTAIDMDAFAEARRTYYRMMGWDVETGVPSREKLAELGLDPV